MSDASPPDMPGSDAGDVVDASAAGMTIEEAITGDGFTQVRFLRQ